MCAPRFPGPPLECTPPVACLRGASGRGPLGPLRFRRGLASSRCTALYSRACPGLYTWPFSVARWCGGPAPWCRGPMGSAPRLRPGVANARCTVLCSRECAGPYTWPFSVAFGPGARHPVCRCPGGLASCPGPLASDVSASLVFGPRRASWPHILPWPGGQLILALDPRWAVVPTGRPMGGSPLGGPIGQSPWAAPFGGPHG